MVKKVKDAKNLKTRGSNPIFNEQKVHKYSYCKCPSNSENNYELYPKKVQGISIKKRLSKKYR